ncbi:hypothetical protein EDB82DRAFT_481405 [Fusarium venenatum]|uniref:uncharacterized protein n=1 Tax=Fusarium venenatum TaxID=56646 RepID=UPI001D3B1AAB|nr:hypothetical protein EDB82DRAFT_481405 [Fusarium venenatum]
MANDSVTGALSAVDGLILIHLCSGTIFGVLSIWGYRTRLYTQQGPSSIRLFGGYGILFTLGGPEDTTKNSPECSNFHTFFFAKISATGGIRYYYIIVSAGCIAYFGAMIIVSTLSVWFSVGRLVGSLHQRFSRAADVDHLSRPSYVTGFKQSELVVIHKFLRVGNLVWLIWSATTVEATLNFNNIEGVLGGLGRENTLSLPGQLLPFLIGLFSFLRLCYNIFLEHYLNAQPRNGETLRTVAAASFGLNLLSHTPASTWTRIDTTESKPTYGPSEDGAAAQCAITQTQEHQERHNDRGWAVRYLIAWLPWLSLLHNYDKELLEQGVSRQGTGLDTITSTLFPLSPVAVPLLRGNGMMWSNHQGEMPKTIPKRAIFKTIEQAPAGRIFDACQQTR